MALFKKSLSQYSMAVYETARTLLKSRTTQAERADQLARENRELRDQNEMLEMERQRAHQQCEDAKQWLAQEQARVQELREQPISLPADLPVKGHTYGPKMISLCLTLVQRLGFRPAEAALTIVFEFLGISAKIPSHDAMRSWSMRVGIGLLEQDHTIDSQPEDDWIWMSDHSNQVGVEKLLTILGMRVRDLPPPGKTLSRDKLKVLAVVPGDHWKRDDVRREYQRLAERIGPPRYLLTDGAVELHETADVLEKAGEKPVVLRDFKHFAANTFEKLIGNTDRFTTYLSQLGLTRCRVQQTELSHFAPPAQKPKSRFMNLGPILNWGQMVSHHLRHPHSESRRDITTERMNEKLGWVRGYRDDLACWNRCETVMQLSLEFLNTMGLHQGSAGQLWQLLDEQFRAEPAVCETSRTMADTLVDFVRNQGELLGEDERVCLSTENLESCFGAFKRLEGQHSKGGFTSLIASLPMLLAEVTPELVRETLGKVPVARVKEWTQQTLGNTLTSKRNQAYREYRAATSV